MYSCVAPSCMHCLPDQNNYSPLRINYFFVCGCCYCCCDFVVVAAVVVVVVVVVFCCVLLLFVVGLNKIYSCIVIISSTNKYRKHKSSMLD